MPNLTFNQIKELIEQNKESAIPLSLNVNKEIEIKALRECDEYIKNGKKNVSDMHPLSIYYVISKLPENEQITFIRENIKYIKKHDQDIFLYTLVEPKSLSYFFSFNVLKELRNIDKDIFRKVISINLKNLFSGFNHEDYYHFYTEFYTELFGLENKNFINALHYHNRCCFEDINKHGLNHVFELQRIYNKEFMDFLLEKYKDKTKTFTPGELLSFITYIEDINTYKEFVNIHYEKLNIAFNNIDEYDLKDYLSETNDLKQETLINIFFENIITKRDIKKIIYVIKPNIVIDLYNKNKELFNVLTLNDWIKFCTYVKTFNDDFKNILDTFEIADIEELFDTNFYNNPLNKNSLSALKFIETKYRNSINSKEVLEPINETTSIFNEKYLKNLSKIQSMFKNNTISKNDDCYKQHLANFIIFLRNQNIITNIENNNFKEIEKLFHRIVMGKSITDLYKVSSIEEIALLNRLGQIDFNAKEFTVEQLQNYNIKHHKQLYKRFKENDWNIKSYKELILKLIFIVGFKNAKALLEIDDKISVLEHLVGNVDVKNIVLDEQGNPILNNKLINLLFSDKEYSKIRRMLSNKDNDLYKYFPRIINEWESIKINDKDKSLKIILDFLKSDAISLPPKYYRLEGLFKFIGCKNSIVNETFKLHDQILKRTSSTIPRITGKKDNYSYEILRLDDMKALSVGNKTSCCFTVLGIGYSCLKHSLTNINGRLVVIKIGDDILAHSWIWRNGDLLCFDNIEISKKIEFVDFFDVYLQIIDELMKCSFESEGIESCIKNITIGFNKGDKQIKGIEKYPCLIRNNCDLENTDFGNKLGPIRKFIDVLPQPIEYTGYSDSKNAQYLIRGNGIFNLKQSYFNYQDNRKNIMCYQSNTSYEDDYIKMMNKKLNALIYIKAHNDNKLESYKIIDVKHFKEVYCNDDWYIIKHKNGNTETFINSLDKRALTEINSITLNNEKTLKKFK